MSAGAKNGMVFACRLFTGLTARLGMKKPAKAVSPIVSTVAVLAIIFGLAAIIAPWAFQLAGDVSGRAANQSTEKVECYNAAMDFDTSFNSTGIVFDFSNITDTLGVKVLNTGLVNLYDFTIEATVVESGTTLVKDYSVNSTTARSSSKPLKPNEAQILGAVIPTNETGALTHVRVVPGVCPVAAIEAAV